VTRQTDTKTFDAIVIGSGASGSMAAYQLTQAGLNTVVLEAGPLLDPESGFPRPDPTQVQAPIRTWLRGAISGQAVQIRSVGYSDYLRHFYVNDRDNPYSTPRGRPFSWIRGRQVGGRLHTWGRMALRWSNHEFHAASNDGYGEDWPLQYRDLEPYYDQVETLLGLAGQQDDLEHLPDGRYVRIRELTSDETAFKTAIESRWHDRFVIPARIIQAHLDPLPLGLQKSAATGLLTLKPNCVVSKIISHPQSGKATGVEYIQQIGGQRQSIRGRTVFLCASAFESVRLLLNSACDRHPTGIGGSSGVLGRYLMDHLFFVTGGLLPENRNRPPQTTADAYDFAAAQGFYMPNFRSVSDRQADFLRGYGVTGCIGRHGDWWWMGVFGEMLARPENQLTLHPRKRDAWGIPAAHIDIGHGKNDVALMADAKQKLVEMLEMADIKPEAGWRMLLPGSFFDRLLRSHHGILRPGLSIHEMGGARMGRDPSSSVVDENGRCWDARNVIVADAACFPSGGYQNPALTIMALSMRAAERAVADFDEIAH
jgi:choline dehydrogenase-like flavoprotein